jgi:kynurenine formamidase
MCAMSLTDRTPPTVAEFEDFPRRFSNWNRWGPDDVLGTLNHITPEARRAAAALVGEGRTVSLALPIDRNDRAGFPSGFQQQLEVGDMHSVEEMSFNFHGMSMTHIDSMSHIFSAPGGKLYNGRPSADVTPQGASSGDVFGFADGIVTRGVLYDVPGFRGTAHVTLDAPVHGWELEDIAAAHGIEPRAGDAVIVRSGANDFYGANPDVGLANWGSLPGLHASALEFLHRTDASLLVWDLLDAGDQGYPARVPFGEAMMSMPIHEITIPHMGMPLLDNADLDAVARVCAELERWEFMLVVGVLPIRGGTGSPVNPIAVF